MAEAHGTHMIVKKLDGLRMCIPVDIIFLPPEEIEVSRPSGKVTPIKRKAVQIAICLEDFEEPIYYELDEDFSEVVAVYLQCVDALPEEED